MTALRRVLAGFGLLSTLGAAVAVSWHLLEPTNGVMGLSLTGLLAIVCVVATEPENGDDR